jgi:hypothetical protein
MGLTLTAAGGAAADVLRTHTVSGLTPGVTYTVTARVRVTGTLPNSVHVVLGAGHGTGWLDALAAATSGVQTLTVTQTASIGGGLLLRLGVLSDYGAVTTADLRFDRVRVTGPADTTATGRVMTARLYDLVDDLPRLATLSRKCRVEQTTDGRRDVAPVPPRLPESRRDRRRRGHAHRRRHDAARAADGALARCRRSIRPRRAPDARAARGAHPRRPGRA